MDNVSQSINSSANTHSTKDATKNSNSNWLRTLAIGFGIVSIGTAIAVGGYFLGTKNSQPINENKVVVQPSPTPVDATANWKTYTNTQYKFEFKYPPIWSNIESATPGNPYFAFIELGPTNSIQSGGVMAVTARNQTENDYVSVLTKEGSQVIQRTDVLIGTIKASHYKFSRTLQSGEKSNEEIIIAMKNGILYEINSGPNLETYGSVFNQILSTFKFTDQNQIIDTSSWKTYPNSIYGFQIQYPKNTSIGENPNNIIMTLPFKSGTNLMDKSLSIHIDSTNPTRCSNPASDPSGAKKEPEILSINGIEFKKETGGDSGAGSQYKTINYSTTRGNICFKLTFNLHTVNAQNFQSPVSEVNQTEELQTFDQMISTFKFID